MNIFYIIAIDLMVISDTLLCEFCQFRKNSIFFQKTPSDVMQSIEIKTLSLCIFIDSNARKFLVNKYQNKLFFQNKLFRALNINKTQIVS